LDAQTLRLDTIIGEMERRPRINLVFMDACRDNPLAERLSRSLRATGRSNVGLAQGLAEIKTQAVDTLVMYAAAPGQVADDGTGRNSPFTTALLKHIDMREEISVMLKGVIGDVRAATQGKQRPQQLASMERRFYLAGLPAAVGGGDPAALKAEQDARRRAEEQLAAAQTVRARLEAENNAWAKALEQQQAAYAAQPKLLPPPPGPLAPVPPKPVAVIEPPVSPKPHDPAVAVVPGSGQSFRDCPTCPELVVAPAGSFMMGSPDNEEGRSSHEGPRRRVTIEKPFAVGQFAVTFAEWDACVAGGGCGDYRPDDQGWGRGKQPVINVSWSHAQLYVAWLSKKTGQAYRLLSEAEREYVARAGTTTPFWWGSKITPADANYNGSIQPYKGGGAKGDYRRRTVPVDSFKPNGWGLYQVHGNVVEWTEDCWSDTTIGHLSSGSARTWGDCDTRVLRGGSWNDPPEHLRSASRSRNTKDLGLSSFGFRVARPVVSPRTL
jgi:formylglycine-generating enzyme required for sulfatase activity